MRYSFLFVLAIVLCSCAEKNRFELLDSSRTGVKFNNKVDDNDSLHVMNFEYIYNGAGVGIADLDNDGMQDLIFAGNQVACKVYLNKGNFRFSDISSSFEGLDNGQWYSGVAITDINKDGWKDVYLTCTAYDDSTRRKNRLFINQGMQSNGQLLFKDMAGAYGLADDSYSVHAAFFDYDLDGDLDLYLLNNYVNDRLSAGYRPRIKDGSAPSNDDLYRNNGDGTFTNISIEAGIVFEGFSLGVAVGDVNKDAYPDIYVSNDYISNDLLYINQGDGTFSNQIASYLSYQTKSSMGNDMADINNDGNPDIFTLDMMPESYARKKQTIGGFGYIYYINDARYGYEHQYLRNMLHVHNGFAYGEMIPFSELGQMMGVYETEWSWSALFADYDNDGDKDLFVTNGYPKDMTDKDWTNYKAEVSGAEANVRHVIDKLPAVRVSNYAFENEGNLKFSKRNLEWFGESSSFSYGAAFADMDNDGDLDYVVNNLNDEAYVYKNNTVEKEKGLKNYIRIRLNGQANNAFGLGAKVELWSRGKYQFQEQFLSRGYASSVEPVIHFGLADQSMVDSIKVTWPGGVRVSVLENVQVNQQLEMDESDAVSSEKNPGFHGAADYLFARREGIMEYVHEQDDHVDYFKSQSNIPHKFSQIGPCMQKGDLNNDGREDIIVGATNNSPTRVFLREGKRFVETNIAGLTQRKETPESDLAILDVDLDGDNDVVAVAGGYENPEEQYIHYLYENNHGRFNRIPLPTTPFPASVVRPCDMDHDGDLDLFIGARVGLEIFPFASNSWFLINDKGAFNAENSSSFYSGMVTDATWSDYDGDGWEDLFLAREWNSIGLIRNQGPAGVQIQKIPEIEAKHGIWYSITAGDFDQDGDEDYIAGNLGDNHRYTVSEEYPLRIYALDIDLNGTLDPIITGYWKDKDGLMKEYPVHYLDDLLNQSPYLVKNFSDYTSFSHATIDDILDPSLMNRVDYSLQTNTTASYILWNDGGRFRWERLPEIAQVSPIKRVLVHDFNRDDYPDVILAGNDHTYDVSTGYYDANKGIVLLSRDRRPLGDELGPSQSGLVLHGMVESLLFMNDDTPYVVAGFNRDQARVFEWIHD